MLIRRSFIPVWNSVHQTSHSMATHRLVRLEIVPLMNHKYELLSRWTDPCQDKIALCLSSEKKDLLVSLDQFMDTLDEATFPSHGFPVLCEPDRDLSFRELPEPPHA